MRTGVFVLVFVCVTAQADEVKDIRLDKCNAPTVLMTLHYGAVQRAAKAAEPATRMLNEIRALTAKHKDARPDRPISEALTKEESAQFATLSGQLAVSGYYELAESRLERDMSLMDTLLETAGKLRDNKPLPSESAPEAQYYGYLGAMREVFKDLYHPEPRNKAECSLDMALEREAGAAVAAITDSTEYLELLGLRSKYGIPNGAQFDISKLSASDAARLPRLQESVGARASRAKVYDQDISNLRYFAEIIALEFEGQKSDILQLGASPATEYNKLQKARYAGLSPVFQKGLNLWFYIDNALPSDASKAAAARVQMMKQLSK